MGKEHRTPASMASIHDAVLSLTTEQDYEMLLDKAALESNLTKVVADRERFALLQLPDYQYNTIVDITILNNIRGIKFARNEYRGCTRACRVFAIVVAVDPLPRQCYVQTIWRYRTRIPAQTAHCLFARTAKKFAFAIPCYVCNLKKHVFSFALYLYSLC